MLLTLTRFYDTTCDTAKTHNTITIPAKRGIS
jgi:hypothetical protein